MEDTTTAPEPRPLYFRLLRALVVGILAVFLFYLKILGSILKLGIRAIKNVPIPPKSGNPGPGRE